MSPERITARRSQGTYMKSRLKHFSQSFIFSFAAAWR